MNRRNTFGFASNESLFLDLIYLSEEGVKCCMEIVKSLVQFICFIPLKSLYSFVYI